MGPVVFTALLVGGAKNSALFLCLEQLKDSHLRELKEKLSGQLCLLPACQALTEHIEDWFDSLIKDFPCFC